ncbi:MAG: hypothetical protein WCI95_13000 [bacterium]
MAVKLHPRQSRAAMTGKGNPFVTLDLLIRGLLAIKTKPRKLASVRWIRFLCLRRWRRNFRRCNDGRRFWIWNRC